MASPVLARRSRQCPDKKCIPTSGLPIGISVEERLENGFDAFDRVKVHLIAGSSTVEPIHKAG